MHEITEFLFDTEQQAQEALDKADAFWTFDECNRPEGRISPASEKDGMLELTGPHFAVLNEDGEWMVNRDALWVCVA